MYAKYLIKIQAIMIFAALLFMPLVGFCNDSAQDGKVKFVAFVFRVCAKGLVSVSDMEKLKYNAINKIDKMDKPGFHAWYMDFYEHVDTFPFFSEQYGLKENLSKDEAIEKIKKLDKQQLYLIIDSLPDIVISNEFKRRFFKKHEQEPNGNDTAKFFDSMGKWISEIKKKYLGE
jgi:hypothetical protein